MLTSGSDDSCDKGKMNIPKMSNFGIRKLIDFSQEQSSFESERLEKKKLWPN